MMRPIGYYVHHQGTGHMDRAKKIAAALQRPCTLLSTMPISSRDVPSLLLPDDAGGRDGWSGHDGCMPQAFHYAPLDSPAMRERMCLIADWVRLHNPAVIVVDVSVEVALFCHLLSVPTVAMRLAGDRSDPAHLEGFRAAQRLIAPFPRSFEHARTPDWVCQKTYYAGFLHAAVTSLSASPVTLGTVAIVIGSGAAPPDVALFKAAADAAPYWAWHVYGRVNKPESQLPANLSLHGFVHDIDDAVARAELLAGAAGDGVLSLAVRHGKRFICLPEARPYDEQNAKADILHALGAAIVSPAWPRGEDWPGLLEAAARLDPRAIERLRDDRSLSGVVALIEETAACFDAQ